MIKCRDVEESLLDFLAGDLSAEDQARFKNHLETCNSCKQLVSSYSAIFSDLTPVGEEEVPPNLWRLVQTRVNKSQELSATSPLASKYRAPKIVFTLKSIGLVMAVAVGIYLGSMNGSTEAAEEASLVDDYSTIFAQSTQTAFSDTSYDATLQEESSR